MTEFKIVPDVLREREPVRRGRPPYSPLTKALLQGSTVFIAGPKKTWGHIYKLAKNHNKRAKIKSTVLNDDRGTLLWFEEPTYDDDGT